MDRKRLGAILVCAVATGMFVPSASADASRVLEFHARSGAIEPRTAEMRPDDTVRVVFIQAASIGCFGGDQDCSSGPRSAGQVYEFEATAPAFSIGIVGASTFSGDHDCAGACATLLDLEYPIPELQTPAAGGVYATNVPGEAPATWVVPLTFRKPDVPRMLTLRDVQHDGARFQVGPGTPGYEETADAVSFTVSLRNGYHHYRAWFSEGSVAAGDESVGYPTEVEFTVDGPDTSKPKVSVSPPGRILGAQGIQVTPTAFVGGSTIQAAGAVEDDGTVTSITATVENTSTEETTTFTLRCSDPDTEAFLPCTPSAGSPLGPNRWRVIYTGDVSVSPPGEYRLTVTGKDLKGRTTSVSRTVIVVIPF